MPKSNRYCLAQLCLPVSGKRFFNVRVELADPPGDLGGNLGAGAGFDGLVRDVQSGHYGNAVHADDLAALAYLGHLLAEVPGRGQQCVLFLWRTSHQVFLVEDDNLDGAGFGVPGIG